MFKPLIYYYRLQFNLGVKVQYIDMTNNDQLRDNHLAKIASECVSLLGINLSQCINVSGIKDTWLSI